MKKLFNKICEFCNCSFESKKKNNRFCSKSCSSFFMHKNRSKEIKDIVYNKISLSNSNKKCSELTKLKLSVINKGRIVTDDVRKKISLKLKGIKRSPESILRGAKKRTGRIRSLETIQKLSDSHKGYKRSQESIQKGILTRKITTAQRGYYRLYNNVVGPNKFESRVYSFLNKLGLGKFKYIGDGTLLINGRSPDFINEELKIVVLADGIYWHLMIKGLEVNDENKKEIEKLEAKPFLEAGYIVMFVWENKETDLKDIKMYFPELFTHEGMKYLYPNTLDKYSIYCQDFDNEHSFYRPYNYIY